MRIEGTFEFDAPRPAVYEALLDPDVIAKAIPGAERLERVADDRFEGAMKVGVGPVSGRFDLKVTLEETDPPASYRMRIHGQGPLGHADGTAAVRLEEAGGGTRMTYESDLAIGGKVANVGQRMIDTVARSMTKKGLEALEAEIDRRTAGA